MRLLNGTFQLNPQVGEEVKCMEPQVEEVGGAKVLRQDAWNALELGGLYS